MFGPAGGARVVVVRASEGVGELSSSLEKGNRPRASSMRLMPRDQISERTEYSPP